MGDSTQVFISYARADVPVAERITEVLARAGLRPWLDRREIQPGGSIADSITAGITDAAYVLVLLSAASATSICVSREWKSELARTGTLVIPVRLDETEIPLLLQDVHAIDLRPGVDAQQSLDDLLEFFARETRSTPPRPFRGRGGSLEGLSRRQLRLIAERCLNDTALRRFLWDSGLNPNDMTGDSVGARIAALLHMADRDGLLEAFARWLQLERPACVETQLAEFVGSAAWNWGRTKE